MPMSPVPDDFDPDDPAEQGYYGERDDPRAQETSQRMQMPRPEPGRRQWQDEDDRQSER